MDYSEVQKRIRDTALVCYHEGMFAGTSGNLSEYNREEGYMAITPGSVNYEIMKPEQVVIMTLDGEILSGERPSSEWRMHAEVYKAREDVTGIVHTHSPYATGFAVIGEEVPIILIEMVPFLGGPVSVAKFAVPGTSDVGIEAVKAMGKKKACLLENHGVLAVGRNLAAAHTSAVYAEDAAKIYYFARTLGTPHIIPDDAVLAMKKKYNIP